MPEPMYNLSQLARITGKSRTTLRAMCRNGAVSSSQRGNKTVVSRSEVIRAFDGITPEDIDRSLSPSSIKKVELKKTLVDNRSGMELDSAVEELEAQVEELERINLEQRIELERLKAKVEILNSQVELLNRMNNLLTGQITTKDEQLAMWSRLIPERSQARRSGNPGQLRGPDGKFKGKGADALLTPSYEQATLVPGNTTE